MSDYFYRELLGNFGPDGTFACSCGDRHRIAIREVLVGVAALEESADLLLRLYGAGPAVWVLSDRNTETAAGDRWKSGLSARIVSRILPGRPKPVPTLELVDELSAEVQSLSPDLLVSVGSGVISDLVKKVSLDTGVPNWCVATAPSVDAYSSATSAIRVAGYHEAVPTGVSEVIVCDLDVIAHAPRSLFLAGLGDLLAKFIARLDWNLASIVAGERYCGIFSDFALGSARKALQAARELSRSPREAARSLTDAVLVSGFAMQGLGGSRPAASAEHTIAHLWEMANVVKNEELDLHGMLVGAASRLVLGGYASYYGGLGGMDVSVDRRLDAYDRELPWEESLEREMRPFMGKIREEMRSRVFDREILKRRIETFHHERKRIDGIARPLLDELALAARILESLDFPFTLRKLGIEKEFGNLAVRNVRLLRNRYTTFQLAYELGNESELIGKLIV
jgi:glycerol-1-phosphate dehydrogenase [NAD(P)+]